MDTRRAIELIERAVDRRARGTPSTELFSTRDLLTVRLFLVWLTEQEDQQQRKHTDTLPESKIRNL